MVITLGYEKPIADAVGFFPFTHNRVNLLHILVTTHSLKVAQT